MTVRLALAVAAVLGAVGTGVDASAQADVGSGAPPVKPQPSSTGDFGSAQPAGSGAPPTTGPSPTPLVLEESPSESDAVDETPPKKSPDADAASARARALAAWQYQYWAWQNQYAAWWAAQRPVQPPQRWYGWQTLLSDGLSVTAAISGAVVAGDSRRNEEIGTGIGVGGFLGFLVIPPVIHAVHGKGGNAGASVGLRLGSTAVLALSIVQCNSSRRCDEGWGVLAFLAAIGYPVAVIMDAAIAYEDVSPEEEASLKFVPWIAPTRGGAAFGLTGAF